MLKGSCCCGAIRFSLTTQPTMMGTCHCSRCRKVGATTFVFVKRESFTLESGAEHISTYAPEEGYKYNRTFCKVCGTALGEINSINDAFPVAANCFDSELTTTNLFHEFVSEKPRWYSICDTAQQFAEHPHQ